MLPKYVAKQYILYWMMREIYINVVDIDIKFLPRHFCCNAVIEYYIFLSPRMIFQRFRALFQLWKCFSLTKDMFCWVLHWSTFGLEFELDFKIWWQIYHLLSHAKAFSWSAEWIPFERLFFWLPWTFWKSGSHQT